ncbi:MAG: hypothetical protein IJT30_09980, partial [Muribaculaceae bacterium]|nr:hypothetical protein [Muribaculaceae bacterium]
MRKKFISGLLMALFFVGATSVFTSCKDYDDDIARLEQQLDANKKALDQIESLITDGSVITSVDKVGNGLVVTLSNGQKYTVTNGTDAKVWTIGVDGFWYEDGVKTEYYALGKDGTNGRDGAQWTIGADGYWYKDGEKTTVKAEGRDGIDGAQWTIGSDGYWYKNGEKTDFPASVASQPGRDGRDGGFYRPNEYGYFDYCDSEGNIIEPNAVKFASDTPGAITAVMTDGELHLLGVDGVENYLVIALTNTLRGLVFKPAAYVDGVPAILMESLSYKPMSFKSGGTKVQDPNDASVWALDPTYKEGSASQFINPETEAYYHVNPKNVKWEDLKDHLAFVVQANDEFYVTRPDGTRPAPASSDFSVTPVLDENYGNQDGVIRVKVNVKGQPATDERISVVALQVTRTNKLGEKEDVTSDYATIYKKKDFDPFRIAAKITSDNISYYAQNVAVTDDYHYRRFVGQLDPEAGLPIKGHTVVENDKETGATIDLIVPYNKNKAISDENGTLDLNQFVLTHMLTTPHSVVDMEHWGLHFEFSFVSYEVGQNNTKEETYVNHGSTLPDKTISITNGVVQVSNDFKSSALKRTPIVLVKLMHGDKVMQVAFIKLKIAEISVVPVPHALIIELPNTAFNCGGSPLKTNYIQMSKFVYRDMNMSKKQFHDTYEFDGTWRATTVVADETEDTSVDHRITAGDGQTHNTVGTVDEINKSSGDLSEEGTHILEWILTKTELWDNRDKVIYQKVRYKHRTLADTYVYVTLKTRVNPFNPTFEIPYDANCLDNYWTKDANKADRITWFNVKAPDSGETNPDNCQLIANLNTPFLTKEVKGKQLPVDAYKFTPGVTPIEKVFVFKPVSYNGVSLSVVDSRDANNNYISKLIKVTGTTTEVIATIHNNTDAYPYAFNHTTVYRWIELNKASKTAKELLNAGG